MIDSHVQRSSQGHESQPEQHSARKGDRRSSAGAGAQPLHRWRRQRQHPLLRWRLRELMLRNQMLLVARWSEAARRHHRSRLMMARITRTSAGCVHHQAPLMMPLSALSLTAKASMNACGRHDHPAAGGSGGVAKRGPRRHHWGPPLQTLLLGTDDAPSAGSRRSPLSDTAAQLLSLSRTSQPSQPPRSCRCLSLMTEGGTTHQTARPAKSVMNRKHHHETLTRDWTAGLARPQQGSRDFCNLELSMADRLPSLVGRTRWQQEEPRGAVTPGNAPLRDDRDNVFRLHRERLGALIDLERRPAGGRRAWKVRRKGSGI